MLFNSYTFLAFFLFVVAVARLLQNWTVRKYFLLLMSYLFYAAWNPPFVVLLWISTVVDWFVAWGLHSTPSRLRRIALLAISLGVNLGMLAYFKYGNFFLETLNGLASDFSMDWQAGPVNIVLPVGISFYTFQTLSYTLDTYRGHLTPHKRFVDYALYVTFFPQLVAGPIVRASEFLPQCANPRKAVGRQFGWGLMLFVIGLFSKVVLADAISAPVVNAVYTPGAPVGFASGWTGTLAFAMEIFYDFFGYSLCAIGVALCLGFELPDNFRYPYGAIGFSDFWRRWHISLSTWLRDYLYIPLGGNRSGTVKTYANLLITMLLGGLWHGASWMFVIWGGLHGTYLMTERAIRNTALARSPHWRRWYGRASLFALTFFLVCITWVFFRATTLEHANALCQAMILPLKSVAEPTVELGHGSVDKAEAAAVFLLTGATVISHCLMRESSLEQVVNRLPSPLRIATFSAMIYATLTCLTGQDNAFIYFQF